MELASVNPQDFQSQQQSDMDAQLLVKFFIKPFQDQAASARLGRPVFKDREYIDIKTPGNKDGVCRPARPRDIERFQKHYDAFKSRTDSAARLEGTPLTEWPLVSRSVVEELAFYNIKTVENLAAMPDSSATDFTGGMGLKYKAVDWLKAAAAPKAAAELQAKLDKQDEQIKELQTALKALQGAKPKITRKRVRRKRAKKKTVKKE